MLQLHQPLVHSRKRNSLFVRLPAERTKVVTRGALLNRYGFVTFLWLLIVFNDINGFRVVFKLVIDVFFRCLPCWGWFQLEADLALWWVCSVDDDRWFRVSKWGRESNLEGEREGNVGYRELHYLNVGIRNVWIVRVEVVWIVLGAGVVVLSGAEFDIGFVVGAMVGVGFCKFFSI